MSEVEWRYTFASVKGTSHIKTNKPCQDVSRCNVIKDKNENPILIAIASDGAGSSDCSALGAKILCNTIMEGIKDFIKIGHLIQEISKKIVIEWLECFLNNIKLQAKKKNTTQREFACTLLCAAIGTEGSVFFQIGDGAIIISNVQEMDEYSIVFWPSRGEYENTTYFATDNKCWDEYLLFEVKNQTINEVAVITDGLQSLALQYVSKTVFKPFFFPIFTYLRTSSNDCFDRINIELRRFLASGKINKRVDDDITLILASR